MITAIRMNQHHAHLLTTNTEGAAHNAMIYVVAWHQRW